MRNSYLSLVLGLSLLATGSAVHAALLNPFPELPQFSFDPNTVPTLPNCEEVLARLKGFQAMNEEAHYGLADFAGSAAQKVNEWHEQLAPLEEQSSTLPKGTFDVLKTGGEQMVVLSEMAFQNANYLSSDLAAIVEAIEGCLAQKIVHGTQKREAK